MTSTGCLRCLLISRQVATASVSNGRVASSCEINRPDRVRSTQFRSIRTSSSSAAFETNLDQRKSRSNVAPPPPAVPTRSSTKSRKKNQSTRSQSVPNSPHSQRVTTEDQFHSMMEHDIEQNVTNDPIAEEEMLDALYPAWEQLSSASQPLEDDGWKGHGDIMPGDEIEAIDNGEGQVLDWRDLFDEIEHGSNEGRDLRKKIERNIDPSTKKVKVLVVPPSSIRPKELVTLSTTRKQINESIIPTIEAPRLAPLGKSRDLLPSVRPAGISPFIPYSNAPTQAPHSQPLLSRYDWRLSSPTPSRFSNDDLPPPLNTRTDNLYQGGSKLIGVGPPPYSVGRRVKDVELWGWKTKVPQGERGGWSAADQHRLRLDRLLDLSEEAEEKSYLEMLARSGTPEQREAQGRTVCRAQGIWLTSASKVDQVSKLTKEEKQLWKKKAGGSGGAVSCWTSCEGYSLDEANGYRPGTVLRFTPLASEAQGPSTTPSEAPRWPQGTLLEAKDGQLIVLFDEIDMWQLGDEEYRIDIGLDDASYHLQRAAIDNLYFDSASQRRYNAKSVGAAQISFTASKIAPTIREWTLQGTDIRELIVPSATSGVLDPAVDTELHDDSPIAELKHLPTPELPVVSEPLPISNLSSLLCDNQLINSWVKRHQRTPPLLVEGDPILRLNASQTRAIAMAMSQSLSLIQGPPGTGKSATLVTLIHLLKSHFRIPQPILLCAPTHVSIDHLLSLLVDAGLNPLRTGKSIRVREELRPWTIEKRREEHPLWERCEKARETSESLREELTAMKEAREEGDKKGVEEEAELEELHKKEWRKFVALEQRLYSSLLATADVFCSTTIGAGATKIMNMIDFPIVFVDEAAMCTEPVSLIPLMKGAQHVCFIGDQKQLPAVVKSREAVHERLHVSLFERLMSQQNVQSVLLDTQYRMRPQIAAFPNQAFYHSALQDASTVAQRPALPKSFYLQIDSKSSQPASCVFISHSGAETAFRQSTLNETEVDIIIAIVGDLLTRNSSLQGSSIGIISPYASQTRLLSETFSTGYHPGSRVLDQWGYGIAERASTVEVNTVDGYQGREKPIIILSTVRSNKSNFIGFLADRRRLNVALTRAKNLLFVVGNERTLSLAHAGREMEEASVESDVGVWRKFLNWYRERGLIRQWNAKPSRA